MNFFNTGKFYRVWLPELDNALLKRWSNGVRGQKWQSPSRSIGLSHLWRSGRAVKLSFYFLTTSWKRQYFHGKWWFIETVFLSSNNIYQSLIYEDHVSKLRLSQTVSWNIIICWIHILQTLSWVDIHSIVLFKKNFLLFPFSPPRCSSHCRQTGCFRASDRCEWVDCRAGTWPRSTVGRRCTSFVPRDTDGSCSTSVRENDLWQKSPTRFLSYRKYNLSQLYFRFSKDKSWVFPNYRRSIEKNSAEKSNQKVENAQSHQVEK